MKKACFDDVFSFLVLVKENMLVHIFPPQGNTVFCTAAPVRREKI